METKVKKKAPYQIRWVYNNDWYGDYFTYYEAEKMIYKYLDNCIQEYLNGYKDRLKVKYNINTGQIKSVELGYYYNLNLYELAIDGNYNLCASTYDFDFLFYLTYKYKEKINNIEKN